MTWGILTTKLGGTDITDGNVLYGADLVDTFDAAILRQSVSSEDTTEYSIAFAGWVDTGYSLTFTCPKTNHKLIGFKVVYDTKQSVTTTYDYGLRLKVTNGNSDVAYLGNNSMKIWDDTNNRYSEVESIMGDIYTGTGYATKTEYVFFKGTVNTHLPIDTDFTFLNDYEGFGINGNDYTVVIQGRGRQKFYTESADLYVKNVTITAIWQSLGTATVEGWA